MGMIVKVANFPKLQSLIKPSHLQTPEAMTVHFGSNTKSRLTARTMFTLAHTHGDILREGWKNILECILQLYKANLMPSSMYQVRLISGILSHYIEMLQISDSEQFQRLELDFFP